jgi:hypothetical protein
MWGIKMLEEERKAEVDSRITAATTTITQA